MAECEAPGRMPESTEEFNGCAVVIANSEAAIRISLNLPKHTKLTVPEPLPAMFRTGITAASAAVYCNSVYVCGLGSECKEIWKLDSTSSKWSKCASMTQSREFHSVAFVDHVLYICGGQWRDREALLGVETYNAYDDRCTDVGLVRPSRKALDDIETYNAFGSECSKFGKLAYAVCSAGNCVPCKTSLYIFGGNDAKGKYFSNVQVYDTESKTCAVLEKQMPRACRWIFGELWENSVILLGNNECFIYDIAKQTWEERGKFKCENIHFYSGVTVNDGKLFVIGCGAKNDEVRWIPIANILNDGPAEWNHHAKLPNNLCDKPVAFGKVDNPRKYQAEQRMEQSD